MESTIGTTVERKITIKNTRFGSISKFIFKDVFDPALLISSASGTVIQNNPDIFETELTSLDFMNIGNGDGFLILMKSWSSPKNFYCRMFIVRKIYSIRNQC